MALAAAATNNNNNDNNINNNKIIIATQGQRPEVRVRFCGEPAEVEELAYTSRQKH